MMILINLYTNTKEVYCISVQDVENFLPEQHLGSTILFVTKTMKRKKNYRMENISRMVIKATVLWQK